MSCPETQSCTFQGLLRLCVYIARIHPRWATCLLFAGSGHALSHGAVAWIAALLAQTIVGTNSSTPLSIHASPITLASMGLVAVFAKGALGILAALAQARLSTAAGQRLRDQTVHNLLQAGHHAPAPTTIARLVSRIRTAEDAVKSGPFSAARAIAQLIPILIGLTLVSPPLTILACVVLAPFAALLSLARQRWRRLHETSMHASDAVHEEMDDLVRHLDLWRTYGTGDQVRRVLQTLGQRAARDHVRAETIGVGISSANELLGATALIAVLLVASLGFDLVTGPSVIAFMTIFFMAYRPLRDLGDARTAWLRGQEALEVLSKLHATTPHIQDLVARSDIGDSPLCVQALQVPGKSSAISFVLEPGRMVALAGETGAGKTTLLRALLGLEPAAVGRISVNGYEVHPGQVGPGVRPFAWVPQDAPIISGSLEDNFRIAGASIEKAQGQLSALGGDTFDQEIGDGKLGIGGRTLSGGERRWVSLARAVATGLPILLLDEPTVGLDKNARLRVLRMIDQLKGKRALVVASHDSDVLALADEIVRLSSR